jgi:hypothetical protein
MAKLTYTAFAAAMLSLSTLTADGALDDLFVSINDTGENGAGSIYQYTPAGVQSVFASGLSRPRGVAFDRFGNLFVGTMACDVSGNCQGSIVKITPDGAQSTFAQLSEQNFQPEGLAFDSLGNLFVAAIDLTDDPDFPSIIYEFTPNGVQTTFGTLPFQSYGLAFDNLGNLFAACAGVPEVVNSASIYIFTPNGTRSVFADQSAFGPFNGPIGLAFDRFGNLFVSVTNATPAGTDTVLKFTPSGVASTFATDLDWPRGLVIDRRGDLFVAERGTFAPPGDVLKFTSDGNGTVFAPDLDDPHFLALQVRPTPRQRPTPRPRP